MSPDYDALRAALAHGTAPRIERDLRDLGRVEDGIKRAEDWANEEDEG